MKKYKMIDLFAGAGGLSLGFLMTGKFEIVGAAEINPNARLTYEKNIVKNKESFEFIENVIGYNFSELNNRCGGIDVVIGGPPCQGFSNANRQKNHLISMNNGLVKEYFRAIKEIKPKAFIMENVSMLRSDTHRFYESYKDCEEIKELIKKGFDIPFRKDIICVSNQKFENIDFNQIPDLCIDKFQLPCKLKHLLSVLKKNLGNEKRLSKYIEKNSTQILGAIDEVENKANAYDVSVLTRLIVIKDIFKKFKMIQKDGDFKCAEYVEIYKQLLSESDNVEYIVMLQKMLDTLKEIEENKLKGEFFQDEKGNLLYRVNSYAVIDYINAILGGEYSQVGETFNAEWFGVPQERRRYIVLGVRSDVCGERIIELLKEPESLTVVTVGQAIMDLSNYPVCYNKEHSLIKYNKEDELSDYAKKMREDSYGVKNHITTKSTKTALERFEQIKPGMNFHDLPNEMKKSYSKPERTQNTIYLRLNPDKPSGTVVNVRKSMWIHPQNNRAVTVREAARLQSFPDYFVFYGTKDSQYQQVGNAVPPFLAKGIAEQILKYI